LGTALALVTIGPPRAWAQPSPPPASDAEAAAKQQARMLSDRATTEYRLGYYAEAARLYEDAYRAWNDPALLYNIGQAYRMSRESAKAVVAYRSFIHAAPPGSPNVDLARKRIEELEASSSQSLLPPLSSERPTATSTPSLIPSTSSAPSVVRGPAPPVAERRTAGRWWLWGLGALVAGAVATGVLLANRSPEGQRGSVGSAIVP
jgi:tetratricopeptide (TPR) repeat protein